MKNVLRIVAGLFGAFFLINGLQWIIAPASIAEQLGMPLLEGVGLSAQIGDMGSFFITVGAMTLIGALTHNSSLVLRAFNVIAGSSFIQNSFSCPIRRTICNVSNYC